MDLQCHDLFANMVLIAGLRFFFYILSSLLCSNLLFLCEVFASCHDDAATASGPDAHCISARSWICAYSRYVFSPWRLLTLPGEGFCRNNYQISPGFQNVKEAKNDFVLNHFSHGTFLGRVTELSAVCLQSYTLFKGAVWVWLNGFRWLSS